MHFLVFCSAYSLCRIWLVNTINSFCRATTSKSVDHQCQQIVGKEINTSYYLPMSSRNPFVWTDLSSYDVTITQDFYGHLFGWEFQKVSDRSMAEDYHIAHHGDVATSAVFTMPEFFQKIELPSFYMSYISVDSLEVTLEKAEKHEGAKIEIKPTDFDGQSRIALLRDPA